MVDINKEELKVLREMRILFSLLFVYKVSSSESKIEEKPKKRMIVERPRLAS